MLSLHPDKSRPSHARVVFADRALSFMLPKGTTFEDLADRCAICSERHHGKPVAIEVKLATLPQIWATPAPSARPSIPLHSALHLKEKVAATMKVSVGAFAALLIAGSMFLQSVHAQSAPEGSYRKSCTDHKWKTAP